MKRKYLGLVEAVQQVTGRRLHKGTPMRWAMRTSGVRLETVILGGRRMTTVEDVEEFIQRSTAAKTPQPQVEATPTRQREQAIRQAAESLENL